MKYNEDADAELERLYNSVGAETPAQKFNALILALGVDEGNWHGFGGEVTDEMKQGALEYEYLEGKGLIEVQLF